MSVDHLEDGLASTAELIGLVERVLGESNLSADPKEGSVIIIANYRDYRELLAALAAYEASHDAD